MTQKISKIELKEAVRQELFDYLDFRERNGRPLTYPSLVRDIRDQARQNWLDDGDPSFRDRFEVLDELCVQEGMA